MLLTKQKTFLIIQISHFFSIPFSFIQLPSLQPLNTQLKTLSFSFLVSQTIQFEFFHRMSTKNPPCQETHKTPITTTIQSP